MNSSTFSFKNPITRLAVLASLAFAAYCGVLQTLQPEVNAFQNQWVKNYAVAERFIYDSGDYPAVIVGTSLSTHLSQDLLGNGVYNLSFSGGSVLAGLHIIQKSRHIPKTLFIETNLAEHELDESMIDNLFVPFLWKLKSRVLALQYTYQPINLLLSALKSHHEKNHVQRLADIQNPKILNASLQHFLKESRNPGGLEKKSEFTDLQALVKQLKSMGTRIVFFEMPVHGDILSSPKYAKRRQILKERFPDDEFHFLPSSAGSSYATSDGVHLLPKSACRFTLVLNRIINHPAAVDASPETLNPKNAC